LLARIAVQEAQSAIAAGGTSAVAKAELTHKAAAERAAGQASDAGTRLFAGDIKAYVPTMKAAQVAVSQYQQARAAAQVTRAVISGVHSDTRIQDYTDRLGELEYAQGEMRKVLAQGFTQGFALKPKKPAEAKMIVRGLFGRSVGTQNMLTVGTQNMLTVAGSGDTPWLMIGIGVAVLIAAGGGYWYMTRSK
jgi:hypothetical protein